MTYMRGQGGERPALYVCHVADDCEPVALLVDFLEAAVPGLEGLIRCASLPGYQTAGPEDAVGARAIAVFSGGAVPVDLVQQVDALRALGVGVHLLSLRAGLDSEAPAPLCDLPVRCLHDALLSELADDLAVLVARRYRESEAACEAREELMLHAYGSGPHRVPGLENTAHAPARVFSPPSDIVDRTPHSDAVDVVQRQARISTLLPKPRPPSALLSVNAGAALADTVFRGTFGEADLVVLDGEFAEFLHGLGGDWFRLRATPSCNAMLRAIDGLLSALPERDAHVCRWYDAGYQLARFCNLCTREVTGDADAAMVSQWHQARGRAWNAFWTIAGQLSLPEHTITGLSALLEDADAPGGPRVETVQCLEVLRNGAYDWDCRRRLEEMDGVGGPPQDATMRRGLRE